MFKNNKSKHETIAIKTSLLLILIIKLNSNNDYRSFVCITNPWDGIFSASSLSTRIRSPRHLHLSPDASQRSLHQFVSPTKSRFNSYKSSNDFSLASRPFFRRRLVCESVEFIYHLSSWSRWVRKARERSRKVQRHIEAIHKAIKLIIRFFFVHHKKNSQVRAWDAYWLIHC